MTHSEAVQIGNTSLLALSSELYGLKGYEINLISAHDGGRNAVYTCEKDGVDSKILRIAFLPDRSRNDIEAEVEYIRYLYEHGGNVANVINSRNGNLSEEITINNHVFFICLFEKAQGKLLVENNYRYREGIPLTEYYYNCGKVFIVASLVKTNFYQKLM